VQEEQDRHGSRRFYARHQARAEGAREAAPARGDPLTADVRTYLAERDSFYLATVGTTGWPYVQFRGGPRGFLRVLDDHTLGWADFRGNLQYISTGNLDHDARVALIVMDYPERQRLKIFGMARHHDIRDAPALAERLADPDYEAVVERAVLVDVAAYDWNCQQHITPRYTLDEVRAELGDPSVT
jgi:predicted pyridoxine 5'-phosphate oxidase superfamily flavin-nucleotide-binding protein